MGIIKDNPDVVKTYQISIEQLKQLIATDLNVPVNEISITSVDRDVSDPMDRYPCMVFDGLKVVHTPKKK